MEQGARALALIAHIDLDSFLVAVERVRDSALRGQPLVIGGRPGGQGLVAAASREARRRGVRPGMPLTHAALTCPEAIFVDGSFDAYLDISRQVDDVFRRETGDVEWVSVDEAFLAFPSGPPPLTIQSVERIQRALQAMSLDAACGVARSKVVASIASRLARPRGVVQVLDGYEARFLAPLKIEMLPDIDGPLVRKLRLAGIRRLGQLAKLSDAQLALLAGQRGVTLARRAAGIDPTRLRRTAVPPRRIQDHELPESTSDPTVLHAALRSEVDRVGRDLRQRRVFARGLTLRVRFADGHVESRTTALREPSALDEVLSAAAGELFSRVSRGERLVRAIGVSCSGLLDGRDAPALFPGAAL
jgi:DNA polymerase IV